MIADSFIFSQIFAKRLIQLFSIQTFDAFVIFQGHLSDRIVKLRMEILRKQKKKKNLMPPVKEEKGPNDNHKKYPSPEDFISRPRLYLSKPHTKCLKSGRESSWENDGWENDGWENDGWENDGWENGKL